MSRIIYISLLLAFLFSCKKDDDVIPNNNAPYYSEVPTILLENYVNRIYIDLIGREPLDIEMEQDVQYLRDADVSQESRNDLLYKLQNDTNYVEGDSSYKFVYYHRIYGMLKARLLEGVSNSYIGQDLNNWYNAYQDALAAGDILSANKKLLQYNILNDVLLSELQYYNGEIEINEMHRRMIYNSVYDNIHMNTFNYVNAAFDNLLFRFPTQYEFSQTYTMLQDNTSQIVLGSSGNNKEDFSYIITNTREFYEGIIIWSYQTLLARMPTVQELDYLMQVFYIDHDFQWVQRQIMKDDEYAQF